MSDCIEFVGSKNNHGYGQIGRTVSGKQRTFKAHRVAYSEAHGPIPDGLHVLHKCDNRACVNVDHLFLGTNADNMRDKIAKGRGGSPKGSDQGSAKLTEQDIPRIRDMLVMGCRAGAIAKWFGVSDQTVYNIKHGKRWNHVAQ